VTGFFVPGADPDHSEARYAELAERAGVAVPGPTDRVRSLRFVRDAEEWTATVGEALSGRLAAPTSRRSAPARRVTDPATVHAVLPTDEGYVVVTDGAPLGTVVDSTWDNPITVPRRAARQVVRFGGV
jgi:hypothetical protein